MINVASLVTLGYRYTLGYKYSRLVDGSRIQIDVPSSACQKVHWYTMCC